MPVLDHAGVELTIPVIGPPTEVLETLWQDEGLVLYRSVSEVERSPLLVVAAAVEQPAPASLKRLEQEYALRDQLDGARAAPPLALLPHPAPHTLLL